MGAHNPRANIKGEMEFGAIMAKKGVSCPKSVYSKNCISGSQGRCTLGFCMEVTQSLKSLYQHCFGSEAQESLCSPFGPWSTQKAGKMAQMPILGHIYPWDTKAHKIWHILKLNDP